MNNSSLNRTYSVLCVDDDENIVKIMDLWLKDSGYISYTATNPNDAMSIISEQNIDIAFIDYKMPYTDGFTLIKEIRKTYLFPIVVISSEGENSCQITGLNSGADDYIPKPFGMEYFLAKLKATLHRSYELCLNMLIPLNNGKIHFDIERSELTDEVQHVHLTNNESVIIKTLIKNLGEPVTTDELCGKLQFSEGKVITRQTLTSTISRLKLKLIDNHMDSSFIGTVRGIGYTILK